MNRIKLVLELETDHHQTDNRTDNASIEILAAVGYTTSLMNVLRMARDLDQIKREGDQEAFNEGVLAICQIIKALQTLIFRNTSERLEP